MLDILAGEALANENDDEDIDLETHYYLRNIYDMLQKKSQMIYHNY